MAVRGMLLDVAFELEAKTMPKPCVPKARDLQGENVQMSISPSTIISTEYRRTPTELLFVAKPGRVIVHITGLSSQAEVEEYIGTLRRAATEANLPQVDKDEEKD